MTISTDASQELKVEHEQEVEVPKYQNMLVDCKTVASDFKNLNMNLNLAETKSAKGP